MWLNQDQTLKEPHIAYIIVCPSWKNIYATPNPKPHSIQDGFRYCKLEKQWKLFLPTSFDNNSRNLCKYARQEAHHALAYGAFEKTIKAFADKSLYLSFSTLVKNYVCSCDGCQHTKYCNKLSVALLTSLHVFIKPIVSLGTKY